MMNTKDPDGTHQIDEGTIKAVIFDLDDTLYPEIDYMRSGFSMIAGVLATKYHLDRNDCYKGLIGTVERGIVGKNFNHFLDERQLHYTQETIDELVDVYRKHPPDIVLSEETRETLVSLRNAGFRLGLLSDGYLVAQRKKVERLGLGDCLDAIVFTDALGRDHWKPDTRAFEDIVGMIEVDGMECAYVADNPEKDFKGARKCGMYTIQTTQWVERDIEEFPESYRPDIIIRTISEIPLILTGE